MSYRVGGGGAKAGEGRVGALRPGPWVWQGPESDSAHRTMPVAPCPTFQLNLLLLLPEGFWAILAGVWVCVGDGGVGGGGGGW